MSNPDFYAVLGVDPDAETPVIRAAYRRAAREHHPDRGGKPEEFYQVQRAWEVLGDADERSAYDRNRSSGAGHSAGSSSGAGSADQDRRSSDSAQSSRGEGNGFTYTRSGSSAASARYRGSQNQAAAAGGAGSQGSAPRGGTSRASAKTQRHPNAEKDPVYQPPLSTPEPVNLAVTSQRVHGGMASGGFFGGHGAKRRQQAAVQILQQHVLSALPASRLFLNVSLVPPVRDRRGRSRFPRSGPVADLVVLCGAQAVVVTAVEVPAQTASFDGTALQVAGRRVALPDAASQRRQLHRALSELTSDQMGAGQWASGAWSADRLTISAQTLLLGPDADVFLPVVEPVGAAARSSGAGAPGPLAAGRAVARMVETFSTESQANLVDRYAVAGLRALTTIEEEIA